MRGVQTGPAGLRAATGGRAGRLPTPGPRCSAGAKPRSRVLLRWYPRKAGQQGRAGQQWVPEPRGRRSLPVPGQGGPVPARGALSPLSPQLPAAGDPGARPGPRLPALRGQEDGLSAVPQREEPG